MICASETHEPRRAQWWHTHDNGHTWYVCTGCHFQVQIDRVTSFGRLPKPLDRPVMPRRPRPPLAVRAMSQAWVTAHNERAGRHT